MHDKCVIVCIFVIASNSLICSPSVGEAQLQFRSTSTTTTTFNNKHHRPPRRPGNASTTASTTVYEDDWDSLSLFGRGRVERGRSERRGGIYAFFCHLLNVASHPPCSLAPPSPFPPRRTSLGSASFRKRQRRSTRLSDGDVRSVVGLSGLSGVGGIYAFFGAS